MQCAKVALSQHTTIRTEHKYISLLRRIGRTAVLPSLPNLPEAAVLPAGRERGHSGTKTGTQDRQWTTHKDGMRITRVCTNGLVLQRTLGCRWPC